MAGVWSAGGNVRDRETRGAGKRDRRLGVGRVAAVCGGSILGVSGHQGAGIGRYTRAHVARDFLSRLDADRADFSEHLNRMQGMRCSFSTRLGPVALLAAAVLLFNAPASLGAQ